MNQELEKLIDLTLVDGLLTEKERVVIYNKAKQLGVDEIEVDVILEGKLQQIQAKQPKPLKEKVGSIKTCPACGASVKPFTDECNDCGHVYRHDSLNKLTSELKDSKNDLVSQISMHAIPINREALIEFLAFSYGNASNKGLKFDIRSAWNSKFNEALEKSKFFFQSEEDKKILKDYGVKKLILDSDFVFTPEELLDHKQQQKDLAKNPLMYVLLFISYLMIAFLISLTGKQIWPF
jgi:hypothetical protein